MDGRRLRTEKAESEVHDTCYAPEPDYETVQVLPYHVSGGALKRVITMRYVDGGRTISFRGGGSNILRQQSRRKLLSCRRLQPG